MFYKYKFICSININLYVFREILSVNVIIDTISNVSIIIKDYSPSETQIKRGPSK